MRKLLIFILFATLLNASKASCIFHMKESGKGQDEIAMYIVNGLHNEVYETAQRTLKNTIKAKIECADVESMKNFDFDTKIVEIKSVADKYKP